MRIILRRHTYHRFFRVVKDRQGYSTVRFLQYWIAVWKPDQNSYPDWMPRLDSDHAVTDYFLFTNRIIKHCTRYFRSTLSCKQNTIEMSLVDIFRNTLGLMVVDDVIWIFLSANDRSLSGPCHSSRNGRAIAADALIRVFVSQIGVCL